MRYDQLSDFAHAYGLNPATIRVYKQRGQIVPEDDGRFDPDNPINREFINKQRKKKNKPEIKNIQTIIKEIEPKRVKEIKNIENEIKELDNIDNLDDIDLSNIDIKELLSKIKSDAFTLRDVKDLALIQNIVIKNSKEEIELQKKKNELIEIDKLNKMFLDITDIVRRTLSNTSGRGLGERIDIITMNHVEKTERERIAENTQLIDSEMFTINKEIEDQFYKTFEKTLK